MGADIFGRLTEWDQVLDTLDNLKREGRLDEHQPGLARLIRYRDNPRLVAQALSAAREIRQASDAVIAEALALLFSEDRHLSCRVLAAEALGSLIPRRIPQRLPTDLDLGRVVQQMEGLAKEYGPPVLIDAVKTSLEQIKTATK